MENNNKGFTLIEVMIALAIFAIGYLGVIALVITTTKNNTTANITTQATMLARQKVEELKNTDDIVAEPSGADPGTIDDEGNPGGIYTRSWTVSDPLASTSTRQIEVTVSWDRRGQNRRVVMTTITRGKGI